jgi:exopolysaccharide production protein ExoZ
MVYGITYLRALAALAVALSHVFAFFEIHKIRSYSFHQNFLASGVDLFFIISGFLMVYTTKKYSDSRLDRTEFLTKRLARIGPLYWLITTAVFAAFLVNNAVSQKALDLPTFIRSMLFIPTQFDGENLVSTIISPGWTLCYEMFFYVVFAVFAGAHYKKGLIFLGFSLVLIACLHCVFPGSYYINFYTNPLLLEFVIGICIALLPRARYALTLIVFGAIWIVGMSLVTEHRVIAWGIGAALMVWGGTSYKIMLPNRLLNLLGEASYSTYLTHMYVIRGAAKLIGTSVFAEIFTMGCVIVFGVIVYFFLERPLSEFAKRLLTEITKRSSSVLT